jgi:hypothetical protein
MKKKENGCLNPKEGNVDPVYKTYLEEIKNEQQEIKNKQDLHSQQHAWILGKLTRLIDDKINRARVNAVVKREKCW